MSIRFLRNGSSGGQGSSSPNIFMQETEPLVKEGIWFKSNLQVDSIIFDKNIPRTEEILENDAYNLSTGTAARSVLINNNLYIFGAGSGYTEAYKFDIINRTITQLSSLPNQTRQFGIANVGTDVYICGGYRNTVRLLKYDTLTDTYSTLSQMPQSSKGTSAIAIGTDIYIIGTNDTAAKYLKYDTLTDTYSTLQFDADYRGNCGLVSYGDYIYAFGGYTRVNKCIRINTRTMIKEDMRDLPFNCETCQAVKVEDKAYIISRANGATVIFMYNFLTNTYEDLEDSSFINSLNLNSSWDNYVSMFYDNLNKIYIVQNNFNVLSLKYKDVEYSNNSIVIDEGNSTYETQLVSVNGINGRMLSGFKNAWHYTSQNGFNDSIETYYGNGTQWVKFKN